MTDGVGRDPVATRLDGGVPVLRAEGLEKRFGATLALAGVSLSIPAGTVHVLVGHNGSGKSTLIKILAGYHRPDAGQVQINGKQISYPTNAVTMQRHGVYFMHQDIGLAPKMSILENVRIMEFDTGLGRHIRWRQEQRATRRMLARFSLDIDPLTPVEQIGPTERAIVGLLRAFQYAERDPARSLVVLDEPTASLPRTEVDRLFRVVRDVADAGCAVLLVTHHIDEPFRIGDVVTVLRNGVTVAERPVSDLNPDELARLIVGSDVTSIPRAADVGDELLRTESLGGETFADTSFTGLAGEVLGLSGLAGSGYEEVPYVLCGASPARRGSVRIESQLCSSLTPARSVAKGMALVPADRQRAGGIAHASVRENITLPSLDAYRSRLGYIRATRERSAVRGVLRSFNILPGRTESKFSELSGGNQQKAILARWLTTDPKILLLHEPTQGIDVGSAAEIMGMLRRYAARGRLVVIASNQYEDLAQVCNRVLVFRSGEVGAEMVAPGLSADRILTACYPPVETRPGAEPGRTGCGTAKL